MDCSVPPWDSPGKSTRVGCHFPSSGDLPDPGIEPGSPAFQADALTSEKKSKTTKRDGAIYHVLRLKKIQYCENDSDTQRKLQIQCNPYQIMQSLANPYKKKSLSMAFVTELGLKVLQCVWKHKRP